MPIARPAALTPLSGAGLVAVRFRLAPLGRRSDDLTLALRIEEHYPELNDALASTVQFLGQPLDSAQSGSPAIRRAAMEKALRQAADLDFNEIIDRRGVGLLSLASVALGTLAVLLLVGYPERARKALLRLADPFGPHTWTELNLGSCPQRVAQGRPYVLRGEVGGVIPGQVRIEVEGSTRSDRNVPIKKDDHGSGSFLAALDMTQQRGRFRFRVLANDAAFPRQGWHEVEVLPPPRLVMLDGLPSPQIELRYPAYTDLPSPHQLSPGTRHLEAVAGTHVTLRGAVDRPLGQAWIEFKPDYSYVKPAAALAMLASRQPLEALVTAGCGHAAWGRVPAELSDDGKLLTVRFIPWVSGSYVLHLEDSEGLSKEYEADLRVLVDPPPVVTLERPASKQNLLPSAEVPLRLVVEDETYAVRSVVLEYRRKNAEGRWLDAEPRRLPLYHHQALGRALPRLAAALAPAPLAGSLTPSPLGEEGWGPPWRLRPKRLVIARSWPLAGLFKEGDIVVLQAWADDFNDVFSPNLGNRSQEVELHIIGRNELAHILDEGLAQVQQELLRVQKMQEEALNAVKEVQGELKKMEGQKPANAEEAAEQPKKVFKLHDQLVETEQQQKQIQQRVGARPEEGLRAEIAKLQQMIRDNKLPPSALEDRLKTVKSELERLSREELQQIEPELAAARKELEKAAQPTPKKPEPNQGALDKARQHQQQAKKTIDDLLRFLDPWASMHQVKGEARAILKRQQELHKQTQNLGQGLMNPEEFKNTLEKTADGQMQLAERTQQLQNTIDEAGKNRQAQGDKHTAKVLDEAARLAKNAQLPEKMRAVKDKLDNKEKGSNKPSPLLNEAQDLQQKNIKQLEKILNALEERREEEVQERLTKKLPKAKKELENLVEDLERLQKAVHDNKGHPDKLAELARQHRELEEKVKEQARQLARLQAEQASRELDKAAQELDKAAQQLERGDNPEEAQEQARQRLEKAQDRLEDVEDELAREQLARIADQLKGLKERQDAAGERSRELHKKVLQRQRWSRELLESLGTLIDAQEGLVKETDSLREKLKQALVFELILDKTVGAMKNAALALAKRKDKGLERILPPDDKEGLDKEEIADENRLAEEIHKLQEEAGRRLQRLLDALKEEALAREQQKQKEKKEDGGPAGEPNQPRALRGDGIPPLAQLKALREEQLEINERTRAFAEKQRDLANLTEEQRAELNQIQNDQARLQQLFQQMTAPSDKKGDNP